MYPFPEKIFFLDFEVINAGFYAFSLSQFTIQNCSRERNKKRTKTISTFKQSLKPVILL